MTVVRLDVHVAKPEEAVLLFDRIEVWKSPDQFGVPSPYIKITEQNPSRAFLDGSIAAPWALPGTSLTIRLDGGPGRTCVFSGSGPLSLGDTLEQLNNLIPWIASEVPLNTGRLRLSSSRYGTNSSIEVISTNASAILGFTSEKHNGQGTSPLLSKSTEDYIIYDLDGSEDSWYKIRFYNSETEAVSAFSEPHHGISQDIFTSTSLVKCFSYFSDATGQPLIGRRVILVPVDQVQLSDPSSNIYSVLPSVDRITLVTDEVGYTEINLIRGLKVKIFIEGTTFQREFIVPLTGTEANMMTISSTQPDPFSIVQALPLPIRMS